jgi:hemoglobin
MNLIVTEVVNFGERPPVTKPHPDFLKFLGEDGLRKAVNDHYESLKTSEIRQLFPLDEDEFAEAKKNASDFFIQILGGHAHFTQNRGAPRMVGRHAPFRITPSARRVWLELYIPILEKLSDKVPTPLIEIFWNYLNIFSIWMINTKEDQ